MIGLNKVGTVVLLHPQHVSAGIFWAITERSPARAQRELTAALYGVAVWNDADEFPRRKAWRHSDFAWSSCER